MYKAVLYIIEGVVLSILAIEDISKQKVSLCIILSGFILAAVFFAGGISGGVWSVLAGAGPGVSLLILGYVTRGSIGYGDGLTVIFLGMSLGFLKVSCVLLSALFLAVFYSGCMLILRKYNMKSRLPFLPFLTLAYLGVMLI